MAGILTLESSLKPFSACLVERSPNLTENSKWQSEMLSFAISGNKKLNLMQ
jgi:hypothetical protein